MNYDVSEFLMQTKDKIKSLLDYKFYSIKILCLT